jgi:glycine oxidase
VKTFDVVIIGGGVIGASIAFELARAKLRVAVLDCQQPGREASWAAAGMLSPAPDSSKDLPLVPLGRASLKLYPEFVASLEEASGESAGHQREGSLEIFPAPCGDAARDRRVAQCRELGLAAEPVAIDTARQWEPSLAPTAGAAAWFPEEASVEPRSLMSAVLTAARSRGVEFHSDTRVTGLVREGHRCTGAVAGDEVISAGHVVVAAGCFSGEIAPGEEWLARYVPTQPVRGQMMALRPEGAGLRRVLRSEAGYLVPRRDGRIVAGSTSEQSGFQRRVTPAGMRKILDAALELCPGLAGAELLDSWSGLRPGTPDDLPILGPTDIDGLLIATGHYRNGILLAPVTARLVREWITGACSELDASAYSPLRFAKHQPRTQSAH